MKNLPNKLPFFCLILGVNFFFACGHSADVAAILCGLGQDRGKMTLGLNLGFFQNLLKLGSAGSSNFTEDSTAVSDDQLKTYLTSSLSSAGISEDLFSVKKVESLEENKEFRFMEFGGSFGAGFGVASSLIEKAFVGDSGLASSSPFSSLSESFNVQSAAASFVEVSGHATSGPTSKQTLANRSRFTRTSSLIFHPQATPSSWLFWILA